MPERLHLGDITAEVTFKEIKNVHLSVYPPAGHVRISAPSRMSLDTIRVFAISKLGWIRDQQKKFREQDRESPREYLDLESHYLWGRRYLLEVIQNAGSPAVELRHNRLLLRVPMDTQPHKMEQIMAHWYRAQIRAASPPLIAKWATMMNVDVHGFFVQQMKTKWGSCNHRAGTIRLNTELAKKPKECLEYVLVHEMAHLLEPTHNDRFIAIMDRSMSNWRHRRDQLNRLPVRHEDWAQC